MVGVAAGKVAIQSLSVPECSVYDAKRPMRCVALEPGYAKRSTRQFVSGGMAGNLVLHEKGWLGNKETTIHSGEGPIWTVEWRGNLIAWANDAVSSTTSSPFSPLPTSQNLGLTKSGLCLLQGVRIYDTSSKQRITYISRPADSPRADLFKCTLNWQNDTTLLIGWADFLKIAIVKHRPAKAALGLGPSSTEPYVEVSAIFQVDCMISGVAKHGEGYLILAYLTEDLGNDDGPGDPSQHRRQLAARPELRVISNEGEELSSDAIGLRNFAQAQCRDYSLCPAPSGDKYFVIAPQDIVVAQIRDEGDHISWLVEQQKYEAALGALDKAGPDARDRFDAGDVGRKYLHFLVDQGKLNFLLERDNVRVADRRPCCYSRRV